VCCCFCIPAIAGHEAGTSGVLAYEGFDDQPSGTATLSGGWGWNGPWKVESGGIRVASADDVPFELAGFGRHVALDGNTRVSRLLDVSPEGRLARAGFVDGGRVGKDGKTLYVGFHQRISHIPSSTPAAREYLRYYAFEFKVAGGDPQRVLDIGHDDRSHPGGECYGAASVVNNGRTDVEPGQFSALGPEDAERNVIVVKFEFGAPGQDTVLIYRNPKSPTDEPAGEAAARLTGDFRFDRVALARFVGNEPVHTVDEIRFAADWADALPQPDERKRQALAAAAAQRLQQAVESARRQLAAVADRGIDVTELRRRLEDAASASPTDGLQLVQSLGAGLALADLNGRLDRLLFVKRHAFQPSHIYTEYSDGPYRPGGGVYVLSPVRPDGRVTCLFDAQGGICRDPDLSPDGRRVLFSYRPSEDGFYHVFEMQLDGSGLRQLTDGPFHDLDPFYLPDGRIGLTSTRVRSRTLCFWVQAATLFVMNADGGGLQPLTANNVNEFTPAMLPDGRILYTRWEYMDKSAIFVQSLWSILPDGTRAQQIFGNNLIHPVSMLQARPIPGTKKVACTLAAHNGNSYGPLAVIDPSRGVDNPAGILNFAPEVNYGRGCFAPYPLDDRRCLVSYGPDEPFGIWLFDIAPPAESIRPGKQEYSLDAPQFPADLGAWWASATSERWLLYGDPVFSCVEAIPVVESPRPPSVASSLPDADSPSAAPGTLLLIDVYRGLEGSVPRGRIKHLRVVEEMGHRDGSGQRDYGDGITAGQFQKRYPSGFMSLYAAPWESGLPAPSLQAKNVVGTVPVEPDGSAHFEVPANRPIYLQALDEDYNEIQRMRSYIHLQPGEKLTCLGCHESRHTTPPSGATEPLLAARREPSTIQPPAFGAGPFDYQRLVQPIWDRRCGSCHAGQEPAGGIDLSGRRDARGVPASFAALVRPRTNPTRPPLVHFSSTRGGASVGPCRSPSR